MILGSLYKKHSLVAAMAAIVLASCGGGSDGGNASVPSNNASAEGTASKGIVSGASVTAYKPDNSVIGNAITAEDGTYSIDLSGYQGPVRLVLAPPSTGVALVSCDVATCGVAGSDDQDNDTDGNIEFGEKYKLDYELSAVVNIDASATSVSAHITPLTTLVAMYVQSVGGVLDAGRIDVANAYIKTLLGLDANPDAIKPIDLTDAAAEGNEQELRFSLLNAAFEQVAQDAGGVDAALSGIADQFDTNDVSKSSLQALSDAIDTVVTAVEANNTDLDVLAVGTTMSGDIDDAITDACLADTCAITPVIPGTTGDNLAAAKALVATARAVTVEAMATIKAEVEPELYTYDELGNPIYDEFGQPVTTPNPEYNADNLIARIQTAAKLPNGEVRGTVDAFSASSIVLTWQMAKVLGDDAATFTSNLRDAAGERYDDNNRNICEWYVSNPVEYETCTAEYYTPYRDADLNHFVSGSLAHSGSEWSLVDVVYDLDGDALTTADRVTINMTMVTPPDASLEAGTITASIVATSAYNDALFTIKTGSKIDVILSEAFDANNSAEDAPLPKVTQFSLNAIAEITDGSITFSGNSSFVANKSAAQESLNNGSQFLAMMPKQLSLNGVFSDTVNETDVSAEIVVTLDNAEQFKFYENGYVRNDLTTYVYNDVDNSLTVTHGFPENRIVVKYTVDNSYINAEVISVTGDAFYNFWFGSSLYFSGYYQAVDCSGPYEYTIDELCYAGFSASTLGVAEDIRVAFADPKVKDDLLASLQVFVAGEGYYGAAEERDVDLMSPAEPQIFTSNSGSVSAYLAESDVNFNAADRYLKVSVHAETSGKLSANLPLMNVTMNTSRTGFDAANLDLTLTWGSKLLRIDYVTAGIELNDSITLTDDAGTVMTLQQVQDGLAVSGNIIKDGTVYGSVTRENDVYLVTWLDGSFETLY